MAHENDITYNQMIVQTLHEQIENNLKNEKNQ